MFLQLEKGESIEKKQIIGIFDIEMASLSQGTKDFFRRKEEETGVVNLSNDLPKSFLVVDGEFSDSIYLTGLSVDSLKKRIDSDIKTLWTRD